MTGVDPLDVSDVFAPATVPAIAAFVLVQETDAVRVLKRKARALAANGQRGVARDLALAAEFLVRAHQAHQPPTTSEVGTTELPLESGSADSQCPPSGLSTRDVAERLRVTERRVVDLCQPGGGLSAVKRHGRWWIDMVSVLAYEEARRAKRVHEPG